MINDEAAQVEQQAGVAVGATSTAVHSSTGGIATAGARPGEFDSA